MNTEKKINLRPIILQLLGGAVGGFLAIALFFYMMPSQQISMTTDSEEDSKFTHLTKNYVGVNFGETDFSEIAQTAIEAVVHVKTTYYTDYDNPFYNYFYGGGADAKPLEEEASGSGVIISEDGYIVTNNHVIEDATTLTVVLNNKKSYTAKVIGRDQTTDIALIKIEETGLQTLKFGNSDELKIGEWVLAVGNPFNLTSTVTAGIVSAKARNLDILSKSYAIESFIQTDAAVNPGNSGGALINVKGELIGINTAIASYTGSYSGYSFAVPATIVQKVVADILEYGIVQRAMLGVTIKEIDDAFAKELKIDDLQGVYIESVTDNGAAKEAGILAGDIIVKIGGQKIGEVTEMQEKLGQLRPGDVVIVTVKRDNELKDISVTLKNQKGGTELVKNSKIDILGATFAELSEIELTELNIKNGIKVVELKSGKFLKAGIKVGFVITKVNDKKILTTNDLETEINISKGGVYIEGMYPDGTISYYAFGLR